MCFLFVFLEIIYVHDVHSRNDRCPKFLKQLAEPSHVLVQSQLSKADHILNFPAWNNVIKDIKVPRDKEIIDMQRWVLIIEGIDRPGNDRLVYNVESYARFDMEHADDSISLTYHVHKIYSTFSMTIIKSAARGALLHRPSQELLVFYSLVLR